MKRQSNENRSILVRNKVVPAFLAAIATAVLIYVLYYANFDLLYGTGISAILFAAFGASAFILFMTPRAHAAGIATFVKAYVAAAILGAAGFYMLQIMPFYATAGIVMFLLSIAMYLLKSPHPPAVGIALAFVLYKIDAYGVLIVVLGVIVLLFLRLVLEKFVYLIENDVVKEIKVVERNRAR